MLKRNLKYIVFLLLLTNKIKVTAQVQAKYEIAQGLYNRLAYSEAIKYLNEFLKKKDDIDGQIMLANCYRRTGQLDKAEEWYHKVVANKDLKDPLQRLYYAQVLQSNEKYSGAALMYNNYMMAAPNDKRAANQFSACSDISQYTGDSLSFLILNMPFNTNGYDFGACIKRNRFFYTSTGNKNQKNVKTDRFLNEAYMNLYEVQLADSGIMSSDPKALETGVNTKYHEGPMCFSPFQDIVYFTRNDYNPDKSTGKLGFGSDKIINLKIYQAEIKVGQWINDAELPFNSKQYSCGHPTIDADHKVMYFASDMPGGFGGTDIWRSEWIGDKWQKPKNLGPKINTEGNEMFPFYHQGGTLYFASDGLPGLGGLDIFSATMENLEPSNVTNIGSPINSSKDDFGYLLSDDKNSGYFSSDRSGGKGEDDIYKFLPNKYELEGLVVDKNTQSPIQSSNVKELLVSTTLEEPAEGKVFGPEGEIMWNKVIKEIKKQEFTTNIEGKFSDVVNGTVTYKFLANADNYQPNFTKITIEPVESTHKYYVKVELLPIIGEVLVIDANTKKPIENAQVAINSKCLTNSVNINTPSTGKNYFELKNNCDYDFLANAKGYLPSSSKKSVINIQDTLHYVIELAPINKEPIALKNIYYDFDKWDIREDAVPDLNMLLSFMVQNPDAIVELGSHTDARGDDAYNLRLSQNRAQSVVDWLIQHKILKDKIVPKGYGETKPLNTCTNDVKCSEEDHQKNRRTEFKVLNAGEVTVSQDKKDVKVNKCKNCPF
ncbi:MAG: flagellar motor protein MotB [Bacteroidota bacterium]|nr:flagellar motor protein MotB [Bacteroidota bacterium]